MRYGALTAILVAAALLGVCLLGGCKDRRSGEDASSATQVRPEEDAELPGAPVPEEEPLIREEPVTGSNEVLFHEEERAPALAPDAPLEVEE